MRLAAVSDSGIAHTNWAYVAGRPPRRSMRTRSAWAERLFLATCGLFLDFLDPGRAGAQPAEQRPEKCDWGMEIACAASCERHDADACNVLASMYAVGYGVPRDLPRAAELLRTACDGGSGLACNNLAVLYWKGEGVALDQAKASGLVRKACEGGIQIACVNLGRWYYLGAGLPEDKAAAAKLFAHACRQKIGEACHALAVMYVAGEGGLVRDRARAAVLFKFGCAMKHESSCESLEAIAKVCAQPNHSLRDRVACGLVAERSVESLRQECKAGKGPACRMLGHWLYMGIGVEEDKAKAAECFERACRDSVGDACHALGLMHIHGEGGLAEDAVRGAQWLKSGCNLDDEQSCRELDAIADLCSRDETQTKDRLPCREVVAHVPDARGVELSLTGAGLALAGAGKATGTVNGRRQGIGLAQRSKFDGQTTGCATWEVSDGPDDGPWLAHRTWVEGCGYTPILKFSDDPPYRNEPVIREHACRWDLQLLQDLAGSKRRGLTEKTLRAAHEQLLSDCPEFSADIKPRVVALERSIEARDWKDALRANTEKSFADFLKNFPSSRHAAAAERKRNKAATVDGEQGKALRVVARQGAKAANADVSSNSERLGEHYSQARSGVENRATAGQPGRPAGVPLQNERAVAIASIAEITQQGDMANRVHEQACDGGDAKGCELLGRIYEEGKGVAKNLARAAQLYKQACDGGDAEGCANLGFAHQQGEGVAKDLSRAAQLHKQACDGGYAFACAALGVSYGHGYGVAKDLARAAQLFRQSCNAGDAFGCGALGVAYTNGNGVPKDPERAARLFKQSCEGGDARGCANLGVACLGGAGVAKDPERAAQLFKQSCDAGDLEVCGRLPPAGVPLQTGHAVEIDSIAEITQPGEADISPDSEPNSLIVGVKGEVMVRADRACPFCFDTIRIAPNLQVPTSLFVERDIDYMMKLVFVDDGRMRLHPKREWVGPDGKRLVVLNSVDVDCRVRVAIDATTAEFLTSGPQGATLGKVGKSLRLLAGSASLSSRASSAAANEGLGKGTPDGPTGGTPTSIPQGDSPRASGGHGDHRFKQEGDGGDGRQEVRYRPRWPPAGSDSGSTGEPAHAQDAGSHLRPLGCALFHLAAETTASGRVTRRASSDPACSR